MIEEKTAELGQKAAAYLGREVGELIKDEIHYLRWRYAHWILDRAKKYRDKRGTRGVKVLPPGLAVRFLDKASLEEDDTVRDLWARLLANATDPNCPYEIDKTHIGILTEMNALDARILEFFDSQGWLQFRTVAEQTGNRPLDCKNIAEKLSVTFQEVALSIGNLWRLGCLIHEPTFKSGMGPSVAENSTFRLSVLAKSLLAATDAPVD